jgi:hypothetical protein
MSLYEIDFFEDSSGVHTKDLSGRSEYETPRQAREEGQAEFLFELSDLFAQRRLRHEQSSRRPGHVPLVANGHEIANLLQLQKGAPSGGRGHFESHEILPCHDLSCRGEEERKDANDR